MAIDVYVKHKILLRLFGISSDGEKRKWMIYWVKFNYIAMSIIFPVIFVQFFLGCIWLKEYSTKARSYAITGVITAWSAFCKLQILYHKRDTINRLMKATNGYKVTTAVGKITYVCTIVYELLALTFRTWSLLDTIVKKPKKFIMPFWLPFDSPETSVGIFLMFAYFQITMILKTITNFTTDSLFLHISNQICERLFILKNTLETLGYSQEEKKEIQKTTNVLPINGLKDEEILKICVKEHVDILNLIYSMSSILDKIFVPLSFMSFTNMLFVFFLLNSADDLVAEIIKVAPWTILFFSQILVMCWAGELIKKRCSDLYFAAYNNRWYENNTELKNSYLIIESFSLKPVILRGAFVFELSLQTYETIIRQVFSTFTVMIQVLNTK